MTARSRAEVEGATISVGHPAALLEILMGHAEQATNGNVIKALAGCTPMASGIRQGLDNITA